MGKSITLGDPKRGITLGNLRLKIPERFDVYRDPQTGVATLKSRDHPKVHRFALMSDGKCAFIELWGEWFRFEPFLNIDWLRHMIGLRASPNFFGVCQSIKYVSS